MGSQTTRTRTAADGFCFKISSIAEDPRKQYAHVGESSNSRRFRSAALLNSRLNSSRLPDVSDVSGGCPWGGLVRPQKYQKTKTAIATATRERANFSGARIRASTSHQIRNDLGK